MDASLTRLFEAVPGLDPAIRYVALYDGRELVSFQRAGIAGASAGESDKYEELIVNPTLLTLVRQRGNIDCGGAAGIIVRYGSFWELMTPLRTGHLSVGVELGADPAALLARIQRAVREHGAEPPEVLAALAAAPPLG